MLPFKNRLKKKKDFESVFKQGRGVKQGLLYLKFKKNGLESSRFGIIAGKNFSKRAVDRNKIKRRIREIVRGRISYVKQGLDVIIVVMPKMENDYDRLEKTINKLFSKLK